MTTEPDWVADPSIAWRILLTARLPEPLTPLQARAALDRLYAAQGWPDTGRVVTGRTLLGLQRTLGELRGPRVAVGLVDSDIVVSAHHSAVDGLGLLAVLAAVTGKPVASAARGVGERPSTGSSATGAARRLLEVAVAPPARVVADGGDAADLEDVYVDRTVPGTRRTAEVVVAAARAVVAHNESHRSASKHVAIAVGLSRVGGEATRIADHSALLRLRDVERLDPDEVGVLLRSTPTQAAVPGRAGGPGAALVQLGLRALAPRLGSTLLVSHLGSITAPGLEHLAFHPVTAGGSGISLGAVTLRDATTLTLRARGRRWSHVALERMLDEIAGALSTV